MSTTTGMPCGGVSGADGRLASPAIWTVDHELERTRDELVQTQARMYEMVDGVRAAFSAQDAVIRVLLGARTLEAAAEPLLEALCTSLEFDIGVLWAPDPVHGELRVIAEWHSGEADAAFVVLAGTQRLRLGAGIAGRVYSWVEPLVTDDAELVERGSLAVAMASRGLRSVCAFPVAGVHETLAVVELIRRAPLGPEHAIEPAVRAIGDRIAAFIERERLEERYLALFTLLESRIHEQEQEAAVAAPGPEPAEQQGARVIPLRRVDRAA